MYEVDNQFAWVEFYKEFANVLLKYHSDRDKLISKVKQVFLEAEINLPTLEKDNQIIDIDPFTVFGLLDRKSVV